MLILALVVAALVTGVILWRRPDARTAAKTVTAGAWKAGKAQAATEFRNGYKATLDAYDRAQKALQGRGTKRARVLSGTLELLGVTVVTAGGAVYGAAKTLGATQRILVEAARGGRAAYATLEVEAEVVEIENVDPDVDADADVVHDDATYVVPPAGGGTTKLLTNTIIIATMACERCGVEHSVMLQPGQDKAVTTCGCGQELRFSWTTSASQAEPQAGTDTQPEGNDMSVSQEATGLTSYALAHEQIARQLNDLVNTSNALVASMGDLLSQHSNLLRNAAVMQDFLRQAASVAEQIAKEAAAVANA